MITDEIRLLLNGMELQLNILNNMPATNEVTRLREMYNGLPNEINRIWAGEEVDIYTILTAANILRYDIDNLVGYHHLQPEVNMLDPISITTLGEVMFYSVPFAG